MKKKLNEDSSLSEIFAEERSRELFDRYLPGIRRMTENQPAVLGLSLKAVALFGQGRIPQDAIDRLCMELEQADIYVDVQEKGAYQKDMPVTEACMEVRKEEAHHSICPGKVMRDTEGKRIQAHGGQIYAENGVFYLYGENKDHTDGKNGIWTWGIRAYRSEDLYNWEDLGLIIKPDLENEKSGLYPEAHLDRPHILKNEKTGKYVCWCKQCSDEACFLILEANRFEGPYEVVKEAYRPDSRKVGDFDMIASADGNSYLFMASDQDGVFGYVLAEDGLSVKEQISVSYEGMYAPFCREGVTLCEHEGKKYLLTSGMSGYLPNESEYGVVSDWKEPFQSAGNPHIGDESHASFNSQISQIFPVPGKKNLYLSIADRWVPEFLLDGEMEEVIVRAIASHHDPEKYQLTPEEWEKFRKVPLLDGTNTSIADYVWLPVTFENGQMQIRWYDEWRIEDFD